MLIVHHLSPSQSERVVWACEELGLTYELKRYDRVGPGSAPPDYKALHFFGTAPVIQDGDVTMGESGAIVDYLCRKHGRGRLTVDPNAANFAAYCYWFHFANGTFVPGVMMAMAGPVPLPGVDPVQAEKMKRRRLDRSYEMTELRLGEQPYFAGPEFTAADIMMCFVLMRTRASIPYDLGPNTLAYLQRIGARPGFQRAIQKAEPDRPPMLT